MSPPPPFNRGRPWAVALATALGASVAIAAPSEGWFEPLPDEPEEPAPPTSSATPGSSAPPARPPSAEGAPPAASALPSASASPSQPADAPAARPPENPQPPPDPKSETATKDRDRRSSKFFLRAATGLGYFKADTGASPDTRAFRGGTFTWHLMAGFRVSETLRLGAGYSRDHVFALSVEDTLIDGDEPDPERFSLSLGVAGVFFDWQPSRASGLYAELFFGPGTLIVDRASDAEVDEPSGILWALGAGYDFPVADHFSAGFLARLSIAPFEVSEVTPDRSVTVLLPALLLTASLR